MDTVYANWLVKAKELYNLKQQIKNLEISATEIENELKMIQNNDTMEFGGIRFEKYYRTGSIDYALAAKTLNINFEPFRKAPGVFWKLTVTSI